MSCQTDESASLPTIAEVRTEYVTVDSMCTAIKPILGGKDEYFERETAEQITAHNRIVRCKCPAFRPDGFDPAICKET